MGCTYVSLSDIQGVAEYQLQLPDKNVLQRKLQELINIPLIEENDEEVL